MRAAIFSLLASLLATGPAAAQGPHDKPAMPAPGIADITAAPAMEDPQLSPDGQRLLYIRRAQRSGEDDMLVIADISDPDRPQGHPLRLGEADVRWAGWGNNERVLISVVYEADIEGGLHIFMGSDGKLYASRRQTRAAVIAMDRDGGNPVQLFSEEKFNNTMNAALDRITDVLPDDPRHILMGAREGRNARYGLYKVDLYTGLTDRFEAGTDHTFAYYTNRAGEPVMRFDVSKFGITVLVRERDGYRWRRAGRYKFNEFGKIQNEYAWAARAEAHDEALVLARSEETGTMGLFRYSFADKDLMEPLFLHPDYDIQSVQRDPYTARPLYVRYADEKMRLHIENTAITAHLSALQDYFGPDVFIEPLQNVDDRWLLKTSGPTEPVSFYLYSTQSQSLSPMGAALPGLINRELARVSVHRYSARDGTELFGYLTHPYQRHEALAPLVVMPHGGPEARDYYRFDPIAQMLAAKGYMVFQPQFRGSAGFGRDFASAGYRQWGGLMIDDMTDGARDILARGLANPDKVCIAGASYGGYAALMSAVREPDLYHCAASMVGVTDLVHLVREHVASDRSGDDYLFETIGHPRKDRDAMEAASPAYRAAEIDIPVLLLHGKDDIIAPVEQSEIMEEALIEAGKEVEFIAHAGGHHFVQHKVFPTVMFHLTNFLDEHIPPPEPPQPEYEPRWQDD